MKLEIWKKDMDIIGAFARASGASTPLFDATKPLYAAAARSDGNEDTGAVHRALAESSKLKAKSKK